MTNTVHFDTDVGGDGSDVSGDANPTTGLAEGGHETRFVPALANIVAIAQFVLTKAALVAGYVSTTLGYKNTAGAAADAALGSAVAASDSEVAAAGSAAAAAGYAAGLNLPSLVGQALKFLRVKLDESGYEDVALGSAALKNTGTTSDTVAVGNHGHMSRGADIASSATLNLDAATGDIVDVTGTTTVTAVTLADGKEQKVRFTGALTLTYGASLVLPSGANITTAAGDYAIFRGYAAGVVRCLDFSPFNGKSLVPDAGGAWVPLSTVNANDSATVDIETTFDATYSEYMLVARHVVPMPGNSQLLCRLKIGGSYVASGYDFFLNRSQSGAATFLGANQATFASGDTAIAVAAGLTANAARGGCFVMRIPSPANSVSQKTIDWSGHADDGNNHAIASGTGRNSGTAALTGVRFFGNDPSSGIASGSFTLFGIKTA